MGDRVDLPHLDGQAEEIPAGDSVRLPAMAVAVALETLHGVLAGPRHCRSFPLSGE